MDRSRTHVDFFSDPKYFFTKIVLGGNGKLHLPFADAQVLPDAKLGRRNSNTTPLGLHLLHMARTSASVTREGAMPVVQ